MYVVVVVVLGVWRVRRPAVVSVLGGGCWASARGHLVWPARKWDFSLTLNMECLIRSFATVMDFGFDIFVETLRSNNSRNRHFVGTVTIWYGWSSITRCDIRILDVYVGLLYAVAVFWGWESSWTCCCEPFGRGSLAIGK